jgi:hypothetical protein
MMAYRSWAIGLALSGVVAFAACSGDTTNETPGSGGAGTGAGPGTGGSEPTTSSSSSGGGSEPLTCAVAYTNVVKDECDLLQQDCAPGQTCRPINTAAGWRTKCRTDTGFKGPGKSCQLDQECEAGLGCIGAPNGWCSHVCCPPTNEPCGAGSCNVEVELGGAFAMMCSFAPQCELFEPDACANAEECHVSDVGQGLATCIAPSDQQVPEGETCKFLNDCADMQHCPLAPNNRCRYYCALEGWEGLTLEVGGCPAGQSCTAWPLGVAGVGLCQPPPP